MLTEITPEQFASALAEVESGGNWQAWGDEGRAMGRWQVHPAWLWGWAKRYQLEPTVGESWDSFVMAVVVAFARDHFEQGFTPYSLAQYFHLGHARRRDYDPAYAARFKEALSHA